MPKHRVEEEVAFTPFGPNRQQQEPLLQALEELTKASGCYGPVPGGVSTSSSTPFSLNELLGLQVMMGSNRARLTLELGAEATTPLLDRARALHYPEVVSLLEEYGAQRKKPKKSPKS